MNLFRNALLQNIEQLGIADEDYKSFLEYLDGNG